MTLRLKWRNMQHYVSGAERGATQSDMNKASRAVPCCGGSVKIPKCINPFHRMMSGSSDIVERNKAHGVGFHLSLRIEQVEHEEKEESSPLRHRRVFPGCCLTSRGRNFEEVRGDASRRRQFTADGASTQIKRRGKKKSHQVRGKRWSWEKEGAMPSPAEQSPVLLCCVSELQHGVSPWTLDLLPRPRETPSPLPLRRSAPAASRAGRALLPGSLLPAPAALPHPRPDRTHRAPRCALADAPAGTDTKRAQPRPGEPPAPERSGGLLHHHFPNTPLLPYNLSLEMVARSPAGGDPESLSRSTCQDLVVRGVSAVLAFPRSKEELIQVEFLSSFLEIPFISILEDTEPLVTKSEGAVGLWLMRLGEEAGWGERRGERGGEERRGGRKGQTRGRKKKEIGF
ncbi:unnamed protein product [Pleuronectes platessa]|uniref:Uncharacterized protein n=1 Tax=Pleuronectes platessa TaxID=8262 RepID=A0A9N7VLJ3_PLEPL|nr:unnamed protein product [Pleuronectes platessa]